MPTKITLTRPDNRIETRILLNTSFKTYNLAFTDKTFAVCSKSLDGEGTVIPIMGSLEMEYIEDEVSSR